MGIWKRIGGGVLLGLGGLLLNLAAVEILPGVHLLLGPCMVLMAAVLLGPAAGGLAGAISGIQAYFLWGHPWGWLNIVLEGLFVGAMRRRLMPITADGLFWLVSPLYFLLTYGVMAGLPIEATLVSGVKQAMNGLLAALIVQVALLVPALRRRLGPWLPAPVAAISMGRAFALSFTLGALLPLLWVGMVEGRARYEAAVRHVEEENLQVARAVVREIERRLEHSSHSVAQLSLLLSERAAPQGGLPNATFLEDGLDSLVTYSPEVIYAYVGSPEGRSLAFSPRHDAEGRLLAGSDFSDREYVRKARQAHGPLVSDVFLGRVGERAPLVVTVAPIRDGDRYLGYVLAALDLPKMRAYARDQAHTLQQRVRVIDARERVVFDSQEEVSTEVHSIEGSPLAEALDRVGSAGASRYQRLPDGRLLIRTGSEHLFCVRSVAQVGWRVVVEQSAVILQREVEQTYAGLLVTVAGAIGVTLAVSLFLARAVLSPVRRVAEAALRLAAGDRQARAEESTRDAPRELHELARTFDQMAAQLSRQMETIEGASQEKDIFLSIASHELKTPLTAIKVQVALLKRAVGKAQAERVEMFDRQVDRLTRLVNQLLDASQLGSGKLPLQRSRVDLAEVARRVAEALVGASPRHNLVLEVSPLVGAFDEMRIEQVLHNLVANAIKYSPAGGAIEVRVRSLPGGEAEVEVADRGIGLGGEDKEQLFGRFERGERQEVANISGLGVGLYVSREIVRRHNGSIALRQREGGGAVATVVLPLEP
ncbi:Signal transduction histidine kinase [Stigmatella aurantiaca]|uniref:histidine kinase n=1 Tax=Stigmatella aurantiaca TaxID=41 RepID=A0A1H7RX67_STIAU|nr:sensor histidine kinase [Stigmatella aurantiaca]SEL64812.1 Signal transduction histidine kinase [Stigmatella aurantiaca]